MPLKIPSPELLSTVCKCQDCRLYETAKHPRVPGRWASENSHPEYPTLIAIGEACGRVEDERGACFQHVSLRNLEKALGDRINEVYLTNTCRCIPWDDPISHKGVRKPTDLEIASCLPWLQIEISKFPEETPIVAMGSTAFFALMPSLRDRGRITELAGKEFPLDIHGKHYRLFAQLHPASISHNPTYSSKFYSVFNHILEVIDSGKSKEFKESNWEILDPSKAIQKLNEAKQLYLDGAIKYIVTDTETSGFLPWKSDVIMFGLAHTNDIKGYSIPMMIQNRVDFPDFPTEIYPIEFQISNHDVQLIKQSARELFNVVPIVGHNIKFDLKMMAYHGYLDLSKVKIYNDTMLMSSVLIGRGWSGDSLGLKEMSIKLLGLEESWDWVIDEWLKKYNRVTDRRFDNIPTCILGKYCALDHFYTRALHEKLYPLIERNNCGTLMNSLNIATVAYSEAELRGIEIDWDIYNLIKTKSDDLIENIVKNIHRDPHIKSMMIEKYKADIEENSKKPKPKSDTVFKNKLINGDYFSVGSVKDKRELLYKRYGVPVKSLTEKGFPATDKAAISDIEKTTEIENVKKLCRNLLEYNKFSKIKSTYVDNLPENCDENGLYHCEFNIAGTVTGRLCVHGDTIIHNLFFGKDIKISDIDPNDPLHILVYDIKDKEITVANARFLGVTRREKVAIKLTFSNNKSVISTNDHRYLTIDGNYIEADNLNIGDELMPIKDKIFVIDKELIYYDSPVDFYDIEVPDYHNFAIGDYLFVHNSSGFHTLPKKCLTGDTKVVLFNGDTITMRELSRLESAWLISHDVKFRDNFPGKMLWCKQTDTNRRIVRISFANGKYVDCTLNHPFLMQDDTYKEARYICAGEWVRGLKRSHKVISIEEIGRKDVYDLEVDTYHNFLLEAGVFVHNSSVKHLYTSRDHKDSGSIWLSPDMSQLELRVTAGIANERSWIEAYNNGEDLHQRTAANMFHDGDMELVTKEERRIGKCVSGDTLIETNKGKMRIDQIVGNTPDDEVVPYTGDVKILTLDGYRDIQEVYRIEDVEVVEVELEDGKKLTCTPHHEFVVGFNPDGSPIFKKAEDLLDTDEVYVLNEEQNNS